MVTAINTPKWVRAKNGDTVLAVGVRLTHDSYIEKLTLELVNGRTYDVLSRRWDEQEPSLYAQTLLLHLTSELVYSDGPIEMKDLDKEVQSQLRGKVEPVDQ